MSRRVPSLGREGLFLCLLWLEKGQRDEASTAVSAALAVRAPPTCDCTCGLLSDALFTLIRYCIAVLFLGIEVDAFYRLG